MIRYIAYENIDKQKWDECISHSINSLVYGYSWYLDAVCRKWDALADEDYTIVFPLTSNRKCGFTYLYQPYFTQQLGIFSIKPLTANIIEDFIDAIPAKYRFIEINLNYGNEINGKRYGISKCLNLLLDLRKSYEIVEKGYSQNVRRNIKTAKEKGINTGFSTEPADIVDLFRRFKAREFTHIKDHHYTRLLMLIQVLKEKKLARCTGAYNASGELCAGIVWVITQSRAIFLFSGVSPEAREAGAMSWLIDQFIREHSDTEQLIDFEGSNNTGLARFYKSFGSSEEFYCHLKINRLPSVIRLIKK